MSNQMKLKPKRHVIAGLRIIMSCCSQPYKFYYLFRSTPYFSKFGLRKMLQDMIKFTNKTSLSTNSTTKNPMIQSDLGLPVMERFNFHFGDPPILKVFSYLFYQNHEVIIQFSILDLQVIPFCSDSCQFNSESFNGLRIVFK